MFQLNPFHLLHASLLHMLMIQGALLLGYLVGRQIINNRQIRLVQELQRLQRRLDRRNRSRQSDDDEDDAPGTDRLTEILGITLPVEQVLLGVGIHTFGKLARQTPATVRRILTDHGPLMHPYDPATWPEQARMAHEGHWRELRTWQKRLRRGIDETKRPTPVIP